jgi:hypothetical protein
MPKDSLLDKYDLPQFKKIVEAVKDCSTVVLLLLKKQPNNKKRQRMEYKKGYFSAGSLGFRAKKYRYPLKGFGYLDSFT